MLQVSVCDTAELPGSGDRAGDQRGRGWFAARLGREAGTAHHGRRPLSDLTKDRLLNAGLVAAFLGVPKQTVYREWRRWGLTGYKIGYALRFKESEVLAWLERQKIPLSRTGNGQLGN